MTKETRNLNIEIAVDSILKELDNLINGDRLDDVIPNSISNFFDSSIESAKGSVRLAIVFFIAYSIQCDDWNFEEIPVGIRGGRGDKKLATGLTIRHINFHMAVTAFGENLGWKGNVRNVNLKNDPRFKTFITNLELLNSDQRKHLFNKSIWMLYQSRAVPKALPKLPGNYLTYARSLALCHELLSLQTEGHVQQFLVAAFLSIHRARLGNIVKTHHPHASDTYDGTCGDIEEFRDENLIAAYEVTVRDDWKNRLPDFRAKMIKGKLSKYIIIASDIHSDAQLSSASKLIEFTKGVEFDLAIVDIRDFFSVFCAELSKNEISEAINLTFEFLTRQDLCGRKSIQDMYHDVVDKWMESGPA